MSTVIGRINHFSNTDTIEEQFVAWEEMLGKDAAAYKLFNVGAPLENLKYETATGDETVYTGAIGDGAATGWDDTAVAALPVSASLAGIITNYAVLKVENEIVVVQSVDRAANTIDVFKRGAGETTAAAHADTTTGEVLGFNMPRGVKDIEANFKEQVVDYNVCGKYTVPSLNFTKEQLVENRKYYGEAGAEDYVSEQILEKDRELISTVNKLIIHGTREEGATGQPGMTRGILEEATLRGNVVTAVGAISSLDVIDSALTASRDKGGKSNVLLCGTATFDDIQKLGVVENQRPQILNRLEVELGTRVVSIYTKVGQLFLVMDRDMPSDTAVVLNTGDLSIHPFSGFTTPGGDRTTAQESARNDQAFFYDTITQFGTLYKNSNKNMTVLTGISH